MLDQVAEDWKVLYPGEEVPLPGTARKVTVFPLALDHLERFPVELGAIFHAVKDVELDPTAEPIVIAAALIKAVTPVLVGEARALLSACCSTDLRGAPVKAVVPIAEAWIRQSFEGIDLVPLLAAMRTLMSNLMDSSPSLSALLLHVSPRLATSLSRSFTSNTLTAGAGDSLTRAGAFANSSIT